MNLVHDTGLVLGRYLRQLLRAKTGLVVGLLQPLLYLLLFGPLVTSLPGATTLFGGSDVWQGFVPGMLIMLGLFGSGFAGFAIIAELRSGVVERMRVTPASRLALLLGRVGADVVKIEVQALLLLAAAALLGLRAPLPGLLIALVVLGLISASLASLSYSIALRTRHETTFAPLLNTVMLPLLLLSGVLLPMSMAPGWLRVLSRVSPFTYVVNGLREAFAGRYGSSTMLVGLLVAAGMAALALTVGVETFRRENA